MREITAKSYRNKFWLKIILRSIGYGFLSSFILGIIDNFITIAVVNKFLSLFIIYVYAVLSRWKIVYSPPAHLKACEGKNHQDA